jgi:hypothetical protein
MTYLLSGGAGYICSCSADDFTRAGKSVGIYLLLYQILEVFAGRRALEGENGPFPKKSRKRAATKMKAGKRAT